MKKRNLFFAFILALVLVQPVYAADEHGGHDMSGHDMSGPAKGGHDMGGMDHSAQMGEKINEATVEGYRLTYQLIDNLANLAAAQKAGKAANIDLSKVKTHHLMLHITAPDGAQVANGKVGFLVKGPDGVEQTVMTMAMSGGYGADIDLKTPGSYTIKSKSALGGKNLIDQFTFISK
ncbi:MAG: hypothetical protein HY885_05260 [Deltaproteobacteria bacterium]|nr:hypothetical protein [Deltaproteobacteria bacterium]